MTYNVTAFQNHEGPAAPPLDDIDTAEDIANCYGFYSAPPVRLDLLEAFAERFGLRIEVEGDPDGPNRRSIAIADGPVTGSISAAGEELRVSLLYKNVHVEVPLMIDGQPINAFHERVDPDNAPAIYAALGAMMAEKLVQREGGEHRGVVPCPIQPGANLAQLALNRVPARRRCDRIVKTEHRADIALVNLILDDAELIGAIPPDVTIKSQSALSLRPMARATAGSRVAREKATASRRLGMRRRNQKISPRR